MVRGAAVCTAELDGLKGSQDDDVARRARRAVNWLSAAMQSQPAHRPYLLGELVVTIHPWCSPRILYIHTTVDVAVFEYMHNIYI